MPLRHQHAMPPIVSLRRSGDIMALLPLLKFLADNRGSSVRLVVHREYIPILDGVSYVVPIIWDGNMEDPLAACRKHRAINAQVHGLRLYSDRSRGDFSKHAWTQLGFVWNRHWPLVFDRRDPAREERLAEATFKTGLPKILVKLHSLSSPFSDSDKIRELLANEFRNLAEIVNLDEVKAERVYDLIGLMDRAACMVSADTVTLWLAKASKCPVISLVNPVPFLGSPPVGNVLVRIPYTEAIARWDEIASAVWSTLFRFRGEDIALVFQDFKTDNLDTQRRQRDAMDTWGNLKCRLYPFPAKRTSLEIGDKRATPFIRDMIRGAIESGDENIIAITNTDISFHKDLHQKVLESCAEFGCYWSYRITGPDNQTDHGADFFAFTRQWWFEHERLYPDMLLGYYWWDDLLVRMMRWCGCTERQRSYSHEPHPVPDNRTQSPGGQHNERLALAWLGQHHEINQKPEP